MGSSDDDFRARMGDKGGELSLPNGLQLPRNPNRDAHLPSLNAGTGPAAAATVMTRPRIIDFMLVCLTALAASSAVQLWPSLGVVAAVGAAIALGLLLNLIDGVVQAARLGLRQRVE